MSRDSSPVLPAAKSTNGASALEWLEFADGTMREALAERLAQAHLIESESVPAVQTQRAAKKQ